MKKPRKFNRRLASKIMAGKVKGRIRTRDGRPVRIVAWNALGDWPIVGLICFDDLDTEMSWQWTRKGTPFGHSDYSTNDFTLVIELKKSQPCRGYAAAPTREEENDFTLALSTRLQQGGNSPKYLRQSPSQTGIATISL